MTAWCPDRLQGSYASSIMVFFCRQKGVEQQCKVAVFLRLAGWPNSDLKAFANVTLNNYMSTLREFIYF